MTGTALKKWPAKAGFYSLLILVTALFFFPFYWVITTSLQDPLTASATPPRFIFTPTLDNYRDVLSSMGVWQCLWNSTAVVLLTLAANLIISLPAAYTISRRRQRWLSFSILFFQMAPWIVLLLPWYVIFKKLDLYDTYSGLVLSNLTYMVPFSVWLLQGFFADVPVEIEEAAWLDGCSKMGTFIRVVVPLVSGGILTVCTLGFIFSWNIFLFPLVLSGNKAKTLPVLIYGFMADNQLDFGPLSAAAVLITLPVLVFTLINQKYFRRGLALGGRK